MIVQPTRKVERAYRARTPRLKVVPSNAMDWHAGDCGCPVCEPDRLTCVDMGKLATAAAAVVTGVMFAIDPASTLAALRGAIGL
jgi:hypothetical protein